MNVREVSERILVFNWDRENLTPPLESSGRLSCVLMLDVLPMHLENKRQVFHLFHHWLKHLLIEYYKSEIIVGYEPTGHYWMSFAQFLRQGSKLSSFPYM